MSDQIKMMLDVSSLAVVGATLVSWLPAAAAAASLIWTVIRIFETKTVRKWCGKD